MGRIQRKKPPEAKRRKRQKATEEIVSIKGVKNSDGSKSSGLAEIGEREVKNKQSLAQKKPSATTSIAPIKQGTNLLNSTFQFLREVKVELKKVTWPSRKQTIGSTVVVLAIVMLISLFLGVVDIGLSSLIRVVLQ